MTWKTLSVTHVRPRPEASQRDGGIADTDGKKGPPPTVSGMLGYASRQDNASGGRLYEGEKCYSTILGSILRHEGAAGISPRGGSTSSAKVREQV